MPTHETRFYRNRDDGTYRCVCTCKWSMSSESLEELQKRAAVHHQELPQFPEQPSIVPFKSGLPDAD